MKTNKNRILSKRIMKKRINRIRKIRTNRIKRMKIKMRMVSSQWNNKITRKENKDRRKTNNNNKKSHPTHNRKINKGKALKVVAEMTIS